MRNIRGHFYLSISITYLCSMAIYGNVTHLPNYQRQQRNSPIKNELPFILPGCIPSEPDDPRRMPRSYHLKEKDALHNFLLEIDKEIIHRKEILESTEMEPFDHREITVLKEKLPLMWDLWVFERMKVRSIDGGDIHRTVLIHEIEQIFGTHPPSLSFLHFFNRNGIRDFRNWLRLLHSEKSKNFANLIQLDPDRFAPIQNDDLQQWSQWAEKEFQEGDFDFKRVSWLGLKLIRESIHEAMDRAAAEGALASGYLKKKFPDRKRLQMQLKNLICQKYYKSPFLWSDLQKLSQFAADIHDNVYEIEGLPRHKGGVPLEALLKIAQLDKAKHDLLMKLSEFVIDIGTPKEVIFLYKQLWNFDEKAILEKLDTFADLSDEPLDREVLDQLAPIIDSDYRERLFKHWPQAYKGSTFIGQSIPFRKTLARGIPLSESKISPFRNTVAMMILLSKKERWDVSDKEIIDCLLHYRGISLEYKDSGRCGVATIDQFVAEMDYLHGAEWAQSRKLSGNYAYKTEKAITKWHEVATRLKLQNYLLNPDEDISSLYSDDKRHILIDWLYNEKKQHGFKPLRNRDSVFYRLIVERIPELEEILKRFLFLRDFQGYEFKLPAEPNERALTAEVAIQTIERYRARGVLFHLLKTFENFYEQRSGSNIIEDFKTYGEGQTLERLISFLIEEKIPGLSTAKDSSFGAKLLSEFKSQSEMLDARSLSNANFLVQGVGNLVPLSDKADFHRYWKFRKDALVKEIETLTNQLWDPKIQDSKRERIRQRLGVIQTEYVSIQGHYHANRTSGSPVPVIFDNLLLLEKVNYNLFHLPPLTLVTALQEVVDWKNDITEQTKKLPTHRLIRLIEGVNRFPIKWKGKKKLIQELERRRETPEYKQISVELLGLLRQYKSTSTIKSDSKEVEPYIQAAKKEMAKLVERVPEDRLLPYYARLREWYLYQSQIPERHEMEEEKRAKLPSLTEETMKMALLYRTLEARLHLPGKLFKWFHVDSDNPQFDGLDGFKRNAKLFQVVTHKDPVFEVRYLDRSGFREDLIQDAIESSNPEHILLLRLKGNPPSRDLWHGWKWTVPDDAMLYIDHLAAFSDQLNIENSFKNRIIFQLVYPSAKDPTKIGLTEESSRIAKSTVLAKFSNYYIPKWLKYLSDLIEQEANPNLSATEKRVLHIRQIGLAYLIQQAEKRLNEEAELSSSSPSLSLEPRAYLTFLKDYIKERQKTQNLQENKTWYWKNPDAGIYWRAIRVHSKERLKSQPVVIGKYLSLEAELNFMKLSPQGKRMLAVLNGLLTRQQNSPFEGLHARTMSAFNRSDLIDIVTEERLYEAVKQLRNMSESDFNTALLELRDHKGNGPFSPIGGPKNARGVLNKEYDRFLTPTQNYRNTLQTKIQAKNHSPKSSLVEALHSNNKAPQAGNKPQRGLLSLAKPLAVRAEYLQWAEKHIVHTLGEKSRTAIENDLAEVNDALTTLKMLHAADGRPTTGSPNDTEWVTRIIEKHKACETTDSVTTSLIHELEALDNKNRFSLSAHTEVCRYDPHMLRMFYRLAQQIRQEKRTEFIDPLNELFIKPDQDSITNLLKKVDPAYYGSMMHSELTQGEDDIIHELISKAKEGSCNPYSPDSPPKAIELSDEGKRKLEFMAELNYKLRTGHWPRRGALPNADLIQIEKDIEKNLRRMAATYWLIEHYKNQNLQSPPENPIEENNGFWDSILNILKPNLLGGEDNKNSPDGLVGKILATVKELPPTHLTQTEAFQSLISPLYSDESNHPTSKNVEEIISQQGALFLIQQQGNLKYGDLLLATSQIGLSSSGPLQSLSHFWKKPEPKQETTHGSLVSGASTRLEKQAQEEKFDHGKTIASLSRDIVRMQSQLVVARESLDLLKEDKRQSEALKKEEEPWIEVPDPLFWLPTVGPERSKDRLSDQIQALNKQIKELKERLELYQETLQLYFEVHSSNATRSTQKQKSEKTVLLIEIDSLPTEQNQTDGNTGTELLDVHRAERMSEQFNSQLKIRIEALTPRLDAIVWHAFTEAELLALRQQPLEVKKHTIQNRLSAPDIKSLYDQWVRHQTLLGTSKEEAHQKLIEHFLNLDSKKHPYHLSPECVDHLVFLEKYGLRRNYQGNFDISHFDPGKAHPQFKEHEIRTGKNKFIPSYQGLFDEMWERLELVGQCPPTKEDPLTHIEHQLLQHWSKNSYPNTFKLNENTAVRINGDSKKGYQFHFYPYSNYLQECELVVQELMENEKKSKEILDEIDKSINHLMGPAFRGAEIATFELAERLGQKVQSPDWIQNFVEIQKLLRIYKFELLPFLKDYCGNLPLRVDLTNKGIHGTVTASELENILNADVENYGFSANSQSELLWDNLDAGAKSGVMYMILNVSRFAQVAQFVPGVDKVIGSATAGENLHFGQMAISQGLVSWRNTGHMPDWLKSYAPEEFPKWSYDPSHSLGTFGGSAAIGLGFDAAGIPASWGHPAAFGIATSLTTHESDPMERFRKGVRGGIYPLPYHELAAMAHGTFAATTEGTVFSKLDSNGWSIPVLSFFGMMGVNVAIDIHEQERAIERRIKTYDRLNIKIDDKVRAKLHEAKTSDITSSIAFNLYFGYQSGEAGWNLRTALINQRYLQNLGTQNGTTYSEFVEYLVPDESKRTNGWAELQVANAVTDSLNKNQFMRLYRERLNRMPNREFSKGDFENRPAPINDLDRALNDFATQKGLPLERFYNYLQNNGWGHEPIAQLLPEARQAIANELVQELNQLPRSIGGPRPEYVLARQRDLLNELTQYFPDYSWEAIRASSLNGLTSIERQNLLAPLFMLSFGKENLEDAKVEKLYQYLLSTNAASRYAENHSLGTIASDWLRGRATASEAITEAWIAPETARQFYGEAKFWKAVQELTPQKIRTLAKEYDAEQSNREIGPATLSMEFLAKIHGAPSGMRFRGNYNLFMRKGNNISVEQAVKNPAKLREFTQSFEWPLVMKQEFSDFLSLKLKEAPKDSPSLAEIKIEFLKENYQLNEAIYLKQISEWADNPYFTVEARLPLSYLDLKNNDHLQFLESLSNKYELDPEINKLILENVRERYKNNPALLNSVTMNKLYAEIRKTRQKLDTILSREQGASAYPSLKSDPGLRLIASDPAAAPLLTQIPVGKYNSEIHENAARWTLNLLGKEPDAVDLNHFNAFVRNRARDNPKESLFLATKAYLQIE